MRWALNEGNIVGAPRMFLCPNGELARPLGKNQQLASARLAFGKRVQRWWDGVGHRGAHDGHNPLLLWRCRKGLRTGASNRRTVCESPRTGEGPLQTVRIHGLLLLPLRAVSSGRGVLQTPRLFTSSSTLRSTAVRVSFGTTEASFTRLLGTGGNVEKLDGTKYTIGELREMYLGTLSDAEKRAILSFRVWGCTSPRWFCARDI